MSAAQRTGEQVARNDDTFRRANEKLGAMAARAGRSGVVPFLCECADPRAPR